MLRMEETEEDVDLRPRRPPEERRYEDRGVIGPGDKEDLCLGLGILGRGYEAPESWRVGVPANRLGAPLFSVRRGSMGLLLSCGEFLSVEESLLETGDLALLADSMNQCFMDASWWKKACWRRRLARLFGISFGGARRSGFVETS